MRTKEEILDSTHRNALRSIKPEDVALIHQLHTLEVLIDIRDSMERLTSSLEALERRQVE